jgi:glycosyltransferase involved in cell wall biosynthesis
MPATVKSLLDNSTLGLNLEILVVLDGYEPDFELVDDKRVWYIRQTNTGMRGAINRGVKESKGMFIARFDEHCMVCPGWDSILIKDMNDTDMFTGLRYFLDPIKWERMDKEPVWAEKLIIDKDRNKFAGVRCQKPEGDIFEVTAHQGSFWIMKKSLWNSVIGELQTEGYGPLYQDSTEMLFKLWKSGGRLMRNNNMWYAHKDRTFSRTHNINAEESQKSFDYSRELWEPYFKELQEKWKKI